MSNSSIRPIDRTLLGATTPGRSGPESNVNERVLCISQNFRTGASPSDHLMFIFKTLVEGRGNLTPQQICSQCIQQQSIYMGMCVYICVRVYMYVCVYVCMYVYVCVCVYRHVRVCMCYRFLINICRFFASEKRWAGSVIKLTIENFQAFFFSFSSLSISFSPLSLFLLFLFLLLSLLILKFFK